MIEKEFLIRIGGNIQAARMKRKLKVRELGALCKLDYANISRMENGRVDCKISTLNRIAEGLEISIEKLLL